ncbi:MAG: HD domain-containing protein [Ruminococcaceae bacterium]|nr:HD domain-containing protein [Oscillospiraceae bacterium]
MEKIISELRNRMDEKRLSHTLAVARECDALSDIFSLNKNEKKQLHISALLHDITKQLKTDAHTALCEKYGIKYDKYMLAAPKVFHALTGAALAKELFPEYVDDTVYENILTHTTGREDMSLQQKLLYLADYIEDTRTFPDCVELRRYFYERLGKDELQTVLNDTLILSFDMTIKDLINEGRPVNDNTTRARNFLLLCRKA